MARGIIITNQTELHDNGDRLIVGINPRAVKQHLPLATVYWDKIKVISDALVPTDESGAVGELIAAGALEVFKPPLRDVPINEEVKKELLKATLFAPYQVFEDSNQSEPGVWSFLPLSDLFKVPRSRAIASRAVEISIYSKVPTPTVITPVDKVLNFKLKRDAELGAFRSYMDGLYQAVVNSRDSNAALNSAAEKIDQAVSDVFKAMTESFETKVLSRLTVTFPIGAAIGAGVGHAVGGWAGAVLGALSGSIGVQIKTADVPRGSSPGAPFAYLAGVIDELL